MILIGQYDSSFVRRVGIALGLYALPFEHRPCSVAGDFARLQEVSPLGRVPVLVLDDGTAMTDTFVILDHLDSLVPEARALCPRAGPLRREVLRVSALASRLMDKGVSAFYERAFHAAPSEAWLARCHAQIAATLARLEAERAAAATPLWFGAGLTHADIAVACVLRHLAESDPGLADLSACPALSAHAAALEAMPVFREVFQPFRPPA
ncbi:MAG: glutathione S-transferase family protein [Rhodobacteraceae bacterium]|jgi:glutathione S-transferase|nr:glutathione S-transferase family protein [Paracoccaceae bacterium]